MAEPPVSADCTLAAKPAPEPERLTWLQWVVVSALTLIVLLLVVFQIGMSLTFDEGRELEVTHAREIVRDQSALLAEIKTLPVNKHDSPWTARRRQELADEIGAIAIRTEADSVGLSAAIVFRRRGFPVVYEDQLRWINPEAERLVHAGRYPLGDGFVPIADGWWWVHR